MLEDTVRSVLAGARVPRELLIVDQSAQRNATLAGLGLVRGCELRYLHSISRGLSRARNLGLQAAAHDVVVLIDDDMFVEAPWLGRLLEVLDGGGPMTVATGRVLPAPDEGRAGTVPPAALVTRETSEVFRGRQPADVVPGANVAVHRGVVLALGGYDERLGAGTRFSAADDNDMGFRLLDAGCEVRHVPGAVVLHRAWRTRRELLRLHWDYGRGKGAFYAKHHAAAGAHIRRRVAADLRFRARRAIRALPTSPTTTAKDVVSVAGIASGAVEWALRHGRDRAESTHDAA
jgi:GT2 family glycosyltransferase